MEKHDTSLRLSSLGALAAFPLMLGTFAALARPGDGNPACLVAGPTVNACSKVKDKDDCNDDFVDDGDCPSITFATSGLSGPPESFEVLCLYFKYVPGENGCETDDVLRTYRAACQQPNGTSCP